MEQKRSSPDSRELDDFIGAYEATQARAGQADLMAFLPSPDHPLYRDVLRELVRVDLEYGWQRGRPKRLEEYQGLFPDLFRDAESVQEIAFEEYRLRLQAGENPVPVEYQQRFGISTANWSGPYPPPGKEVEGPANPGAEPPGEAGVELASLTRVYEAPQDALFTKALDKLPLQQRAVLELRLQGHDVSEIAQKMGRSRRTIERILQETHKQLSDLLGERD
jgi:RNA polymerase sigma factor (sigma-70 family)